MEAAITVFVYELLDTYISDMIKYGKIDKSILDHIHIDRSNDLLKNLELSQNKEAVLHKAFEACPYNLQVYSKTLNYGVLDYNSYQTAQYFKQGNNILFSLVGNLGEVEFPSKFKINYNAAEKLSEFTNSDVKSVLIAKTNDYATAIVQAYQRVVDMLTNKELCRKIIREFDDTSILSGNAICKERAHTYVDAIVTHDIWNQLVNQCGQANLLERIIALVPKDIQVTTKTDVDNYFIHQLVLAYEDARKAIAVQIKKKQAAEHAQRQLEKKRKARNK